MRAFFICHKGRQKADQILAEHGYILYCPKCLYRNATRTILNNNTCPECQSKLDYAGPLWLGKIWDTTLTKTILKNTEHKKFLTTIYEESKIGQITFYDIHRICKAHKLPIPRTEKLLKLPKTTLTHFTPTGIRSEISLKELIAAIQT
jgi:tRNA (guanine26-N2/guanine27-N2)-dimethyltransferase